MIALAPGRWACRAGAAAILPAIAVLSTVHVFGDRITLIFDGADPRAAAWLAVIGLVAALLIRRRVVRALWDRKWRAANRSPQGLGAEVAPRTPITVAGQMTDRALAIAYGAGLSGIVFANAAWYLRGQPDGYAWHAGFALAALIITGVGFWQRAAILRYATGAFALSLLMLLVFSAVIFPRTVAAQAREIAQGQPYCLARHTVNLPITSLADLSLLTIEKSNKRRGTRFFRRYQNNLALLVEHNDADAEYLPLNIFAWSFEENRFQPSPAKSNLTDVNCIPKTDFLDPLQPSDALEISLFDRYLRVPLTHTPDREIGGIGFVVASSDLVPNHDTGNAPDRIRIMAQGYSARLTVGDSVREYREAVGNWPLEFGLHRQEDATAVRYVNVDADSGLIAATIICSKQDPAETACRHMFFAGPIPWTVDTSEITTVIVLRYPQTFVPFHAGIEARLTDLYNSFLVAD